MKTTKPQSIADKEAEARKDSVLLNHAYLYDSAKGRLLPKNYRNVRPEILEVFGDLVDVATKYKRLTGRHLSILGELGELFAEIMFGIKRHKPMTQGSDGMLGNDFVEVKTITPDKKSDVVQIKRAGNFSKLVVVKISGDFQFAARMVDRRILEKGNGKRTSLSWDAMIAGEKDQEVHRNSPSAKGLRSLSKSTSPSCAPSFNCGSSWIRTATSLERPKTWKGSTLSTITRNWNPALTSTGSPAIRSDQSFHPCWHHVPQSAPQTPGALSDSPGCQRTQCR